MELIRNSNIIDRKFKEFFIPSILTAMSTSMILIVDGLIVSNMLGTKEFAAVNCCLPFLQLLAMISDLLGLGGSVAISIARGRHSMARFTMPEQSRGASSHTDSAGYRDRRFQ